MGGYVKRKRDYSPEAWAKHLAKLREHRRGNRAYLKRLYAWRKKNRIRLIEQRRAAHEANKTQENARSREWKRANKVKTAAITAAWKKQNYQQVLAHNSNYRARQYNAKGHYSQKDIAKLLIKQNGICFCGFKFGPFHVDHKVPLSRGGSNDRRNLQLLCSPCNLSKGTKTMTEWLRG